MDLFIKESTFKKNIQKLGYNFSIVYYDNLITYLKTRAQSDILRSIQNNNIQETIELIFGDVDEPSLAFLYDIDYINTISDQYLIHLIEHQYLNAFLVPVEENISSATMINAYKLSLFNDLHSYISDDSYSFPLFLSFIKKETNFFSPITTPLKRFNTTFNLSSASYIKAQNVTEILLEEEIKNDIKNEFYQLISKFINALQTNNFYIIFKPYIRPYIKQFKSFIEKDSI